MPSRVKLPRQRLAICRMMLDIMRTVNVGYRDADGELVGATADDIVLMTAILVGQIETRPLNASKLATYAGLPRPTVVRKLRQLEAGGLVSREPGGGYVLPLQKINRPQMLDAVEKCIRIVTDAAAALSKLDT